MRRILSSLGFFTAVLSSATLSWADDEWTRLLPDGDGKQETRELCSSCHNLQKVVFSRKTSQEWERTIYDMIARGAQIFPDEAEKINKYLAASFPPSKPAN